jgi:hypothetical protein
MDDVHELRLRRALDAVNLWRLHGASEEDADLKVTSPRTHEEVAGVAGEHDRGARRVDPLIAKSGCGFPQPLVGVFQILGQVSGERRFGRGPAVVGFAWLDQLLAMVALASGHPGIVSPSKTGKTHTVSSGVPSLSFKFSGISCPADRASHLLR